MPGQSDEIWKFFEGLSWPSIVFKSDRISCPAGDLLIKENNKYILNIIFFNRADNKYEKRNNRPTFEIDSEIDLLKLIYAKRGINYDFKYFDYIKRVLSINDEIFHKIKITKIGSEIRRYAKRGFLVIQEEIILNLINDSKEVYFKGKSSKNRLETYLINKLKVRYTNNIPKEVTTTDKGDFSFLIERFNLKTKKRRKDYEKYIDENDIQNLSRLAEKMIRDEVFPKEFLKSLDEYFIKEKLRDIIRLGRKILALGKNDIKSKKARKIIAEISDTPNEIKQLENIWQKYFERYLLYLVFSYKKIYPKIELVNIHSDKKYPDFIGINHYNGLDIIEIKTHLKNAVCWDESHKNFSFSSELSRSIIQTMNYMDAIVQRRFQNPEDNSKITQSTEEENLYHPRGIIIISSHAKLASRDLDKKRVSVLQRDFTKLRNSLQNIEILTFDEILQIADDYIKNINSE
ncbi:DUF4263 domain-containing protein [bacterium]|nr:DUF4263 domain-containing protein [bacterium]